MSDAPRKDTSERLRLQQFGLKESSYERPNQNWVCGHLSEGLPCAIGPDAKGKCLATSECHPIKKGDRWICTRRDAAGAPCPCGDGPLPDGQCALPIVTCSPVRSIRAKRGRFTFATFALSIGVLSFFILGPDRAAFVVPGQLTNAHAQVLKSHQAEDCAACHVAGSGDASRWLSVAFAPPVGAVQNEKCLNCHLPALGHDASLPHSLPAIRLARLTSTQHPPKTRTAGQVLASFAPFAVTTPQGELACATCHQEHRGRNQDLTAMTDLSCQVCHRSQFESFTNGHPEFKAVPRERVGIIFDHAAHEPRMPNGKLDCSQCHRPDPAGRTMHFTSFEQACAGCHDQGKVDHHGDQIREDVHVVFQLPSMTLDQGGYWPKQALAPGTSLTPIMHLLIAGDNDPATLQALKSLDSDTQAAGSLDDWDAESPTKALLAVAIKRVVKELTLDDDPAPQPSNSDLLRARIARAAGIAPRAAAVSAMLDQLTAASDEIRAWQQACLPNLADDLAGKLKAAATAPSDDSAAAPNWKLPKNESTWYIDTAAAAVDFRPNHADAFDRSCVDLLALSAVPGTPLKIVKTMSDDDFLAALRGKLLMQTSTSCAKCHAIQPGNDTFLVNWNAAGHTLHAAGYIKFDHKPHLTLFASSQACASCHKVDAAAPSPIQLSDASVGFSLGKPNHGMAAHNKAECSQCHTPSGAPDTCLTCHVYHRRN